MISGWSEEKGKDKNVFEKYLISNDWIFDYEKKCICNTQSSLFTLHYILTVTKCLCNT